MKIPAQTTAPTASNRRNWTNGIPAEPASGGRNAWTPITKRPKITVVRP
jgi:hypothetical protein